MFLRPLDWDWPQAARLFRLKLLCMVTTQRSGPSFLHPSTKGQAWMTNSELQRQTWRTLLKARRWAVGGLQLLQLSHALRASVHKSHAS